MVKKKKAAAKTDKLDLYKINKADYAASKTKPQIVEINSANYLTIDGVGEPGGDLFQAKIGGLYTMAFTIKMTRKFDCGQDYKVCCLEGFWWGAKKNPDFWNQSRDSWCWKMIIRTPDFIDKNDMAAARRKLTDKGKDPEFKNVKLETLAEGPCVQMLHVGPYAEEPATIEKMLAYAKSEGFTPHGRHHEIYLSDPRRTAPERLRTILRQPVKT